MIPRLSSDSWKQTKRPRRAAGDTSDCSTGIVEFKKPYSASALPPAHLPGGETYHAETRDDSRADHGARVGDTSLEGRTTEHDDRAEHDAALSAEPLADEGGQDGAGEAADLIDGDDGAQQSVIGAVGEEGVLEGGFVNDTACTPRQLPIRAVPQLDVGDSPMTPLS